MPNTQSANKALRQSFRRRKGNIRSLRMLRRAEKGLARHLESKSSSDAYTSLNRLYQTADKAAKRGVIRTQTADRKKSRALRRVRVLSEASRAS